MKTKLRKRYYCDFCKKSGGSAYHMRNHEKHCTLNPHRQCRMCELVGNVPEDMAMLVALLPDPKQYAEPVVYDGEVVAETFSDGLKGPLIAGIKAVSAKASGCPACVLAALRQRGIPAYARVDLWDYTSECKTFWEEYNAHHTNPNHY